MKIRPQRVASMMVIFGNLKEKNQRSISDGRMLED
jgi:hypothetical protein